MLHLYHQSWSELARVISNISATEPPKTEDTAPTLRCHGNWLAQAPLIIPPIPKQTNRHTVIVHKPVVLMNFLGENIISVKEVVKLV